MKNVRVFGAMAPLSKETMAILVGIVLAFMLINFNEKLGLVFGFLVLLDTAMILLTDSQVNYFGPERDITRFKDIITGVFGYAIFIIFAAVIGSVVIGGSLIEAPLQAVFMKLQSTQPVLEGNQILTFIGWGILIPIVETGFFFGRILQWVAKKFKVLLDIKNVKAWILFVLISTAFTLFHLTARAVAVTAEGIVFDNFALVLTFIFGMISCVLVVWAQELSSATYMHITSNSVAVAGNMGYRIVNSILGI